MVNFDKIISSLKDHFTTGISDDVWSYLIFPNGEIIGSLMHRDMLEHLLDNDLISEDDYYAYDTDIFTEKLDCIRCTNLPDENYISLPGSNLTEKQFSSLEKFIDDNIKRGRKSIEVIHDFGTSEAQSQTYNYKSLMDEEVWPTDHIIKRISQFYDSGRLREEAESEDELELDVPSFEELLNMDDKAAQECLSEVDVEDFDNYLIETFGTRVTAVLEKLKDWPELVRPTYQIDKARNIIDEKIIEEYNKRGIELSDGWTHLGGYTNPNDVVLVETVNNSITQLYLKITHHWCCSKMFFNGTQVIWDAGSSGVTNAARDLKKYRYEFIKQFIKTFPIAEEVINKLTTLPEIEEDMEFELDVNDSSELPVDKYYINKTNHGNIISEWTLNGLDYNRKKIIIEELKKVENHLYLNGYSSLEAMYKSLEKYSESDNHSWKITLAYREGYDENSIRVLFFVSPNNSKSVCVFYFELPNKSKIAQVRSFCRKVKLPEYNKAIPADVKISVNVTPGDDGWGDKRKLVMEDVDSDLELDVDTTDKQDIEVTDTEIIINNPDKISRIISALRFYYGHFLLEHNIEIVDEAPITIYKIKPTGMGDIQGMGDIRLIMKLITTPWGPNNNFTNVKVILDRPIPGFLSMFYQSIDMTDKKFAKMVSKLSVKPSSPLNENRPNRGLELEISEPLFDIKDNTIYNIKSEAAQYKIAREILNYSFATYPNSGRRIQIGDLDLSSIELFSNGNFVEAFIDLKGRNQRIAAVCSPNTVREIANILEIPTEELLNDLHYDMNKHGTRDLYHLDEDAEIDLEINEPSYEKTVSYLKVTNKSVMDKIIEFLKAEEIIPFTVEEGEPIFIWKSSPDEVSISLKANWTDSLGNEHATITFRIGLYVSSMYQEDSYLYKLFSLLGDPEEVFKDLIRCQTKPQNFNGLEEDMDSVELEVSENTLNKQRVIELITKYIEGTDETVLVDDYIFEIFGNYVDVVFRVNDDCSIDEYRPTTLPNEEAEREYLEKVYNKDREALKPYEDNSEDLFIHHWDTIRDFVDDLAVRWGWEDWNDFKKMFLKDSEVNYIG